MNIYKVPPILLEMLLLPVKPIFIYSSHTQQSDIFQPSEFINMHFFSLATLALANSFIAPSFAAPTQENALDVRQTPADAPAALAIVKQLYVDVKQYTAVISTSRDPLYLPISEC